MYLMRSSRKGMDMMGMLEEAGYHPHSPVKRIVLCRNPVPYKGVYKVGHEDKSLSFIKDSLEIEDSFGFGDEGQAVRHLDFYRKFACDAENVYNSMSFLAVSRGNGGYGIMASMPGMMTVTMRKNRAFFENIGKLEEKKADLFSRWPKYEFNEDLTSHINYGLADDGEFYYFDLHLFARIPSPLLDDPRITSTSA